MFSFFSSKKYVVQDYPDFTIMHFELHSPSSPKSLMVVAHGCQAQQMPRIYTPDKVLHFYTPDGTELMISDAEALSFQCRIGQLAPVESIRGWCPDYILGHDVLTVIPFYLWFYLHPLINQKPAINSTADLGHLNYHDVLMVKPGRDVLLSRILRQVPNYRDVHCMICRTT